MPTPLALNFKPGVQRDGTNVDSDSCIASLWNRFRLARPRKMNGYHMASDDLIGIGRRIHMFYNGDQTIIHVGTSKSLQQIILDSNGNFVSTHDRTPLAFPGGPSPGWSLDALFDTTSSAVTLVAHAVPNIDTIGNTTRGPIYTGIIDAVTPLTALTPPGDPEGGDYTAPSVAGGIVCIQPYVFDFDLDGFIGWSSPNNVQKLGLKQGTSGAGNARASAQKIVTGLPVRGSGTSPPAALFWSLSELISANYVGGSPIFAFNTISPNSSILSAQSVIEYDGLYFWAGVDRFLVYNGTVVEVENPYNQDFFFDNLNWAAAGKSFVTKVPRYGEIWFCAPLFGATEPNFAVIYNIREKCWYDTELPNGGRTAGYFAQGFRYPVMTSPVPSGGAYKLWLHEHGKDQTGDGDPEPIRSYFETPFIGGPRNSPPDDKGISFLQLEADIRQVGDMVVWVSGSWNPRAGDYSTGAAFLKANPETTEQLVGLNSARRLGRLHFESYTLNGDYIVGRSVVHVESSDALKTGGKDTPMLTSSELPTGAASPPQTVTTEPLANFLPPS